jgi:hypothetical protein
MDWVFSTAADATDLQPQHGWVICETIAVAVRAAAYHLGCGAGCTSYRSTRRLRRGVQTRWLIKSKKGFGFFWFIDTWSEAAQRAAAHKWIARKWIA